MLISLRRAEVECSISLMLCFVLPGENLHSAVSDLVGHPTNPDDLLLRLQALHPETVVTLEHSPFLISPCAELRVGDQVEIYGDLITLHAAVAHLRLAPHVKPQITITLNATGWEIKTESVPGQLPCQLFLMKLRALLAETEPYRSVL